MALTERLALLVSLDAGGAVKGLESIGRAADRNLGRAESKLDRMGSRFQKAGAGMLAGAGLAATGLFKAGQAAADLEQAVGGTEAVFKDTAGVIDKFAKDAASDMGLSERAFREATTSIGGQLKGLGFSVEDAADQAVDLTKVAADLAATYGGTTAEAVTALGAAFRGEADPAERFNLFLNQNRVNAKAVELGLAATTSQVDAHAKAQATLALITEQSTDALGQFGREAGSASGQMQIAAAEFENAKAALGESVTPILAAAAGGLADLASGFSDANEASGGLLSKLATFGTIGLGVAGGVTFITGKLITMRDTLGGLVRGLRGAEGGLSRVGKAGVLAGVAVGAVALGNMIRNATKLTLDLDALATNLANIDNISEDQAHRMLASAAAFGRLDDTVSDLADTNVLAAERLIELAESYGVTGDELQRLKDIVDQKRSSDVQGAKDQEAYAEQVEAAVGPAEDLGEATESLTDKLKEQAEAYDGLLDAVLAQFDADIGYRRSLNKTEDALEDVNTALNEHGRKSEEYERALLDAESALLDQAEAAVRLYEDTVTAAGGTLTASEKTAIYRGKLEELAGTLKPGSPLRSQLDKYILQLASIPKTVGTQIIVDAGGSFQTLQELVGYLDAIGRHPVGSQITGFTSLLDFKQDQLRADGGPVAANTPYIVGEEGPEVFVPAMSGTIIPNHELSTSPTHTSRSGGGTQVVQLVVDGRVLAEVVAEHDALASRNRGDL